MLEENPSIDEKALQDLIRSDQSNVKDSNKVKNH